MHTVIINVKALRIHNYKNGVVGIEVAANPISNEQHKLILSLFPTLSDKAYELMNKEALLLSLEGISITESEHKDVEISDVIRDFTRHQLDGEYDKPVIGKAFKK